MKGAGRTSRGDHQRPVEEVVALLAARLGDEQAAVTRGSVEEPLLVGIRGVVLSTDRIVGAETAQLQSPSEMALDVPPHFHQAAESPLGSGRSGMDQYPVAVLPSIDPLADGARR